MCMTCIDVYCVFPWLYSFPGFNSNINLPGREECGSAPTSPSLQLQDKNANNHSPHSSSPAPVENGNQISNGNSHSCIVHLQSEFKSHGFHRQRWKAGNEIMKWPMKCGRENTGIIKDARLVKHYFSLTFPWAFQKAYTTPCCMPVSEKWGVLQLCTCVWEDFQSS